MHWNNPISKRAHSNRRNVIGLVSGNDDDGPDASQTDSPNVATPPVAGIPCMAGPMMPGMPPGMVRPPFGVPG
jgi:hypothetical protein